MATRLHKTALAAVMTAALAWTFPAESAETLNILPGFAMALRVPGADSRGKFTAIIGKPDIADITYGPQNVFLLVGKTVGTTNMVVLNNDTGAEIYNATIVVGTGVDVSIRVFIGMNQGQGFFCNVSFCSPEKTQ
jgi:hypothetical protein